jgi:hypothetical protein
MRCVARADADHDGQINFTEFRALVRELDGDDLGAARCASGSSETDARPPTGLPWSARINIDEFRGWWSAVPRGSRLVAVWPA